VAPQPILCMWSGKKSGFTRTKIIFVIGVLALVAVILVFYPKMISNNVELNSGSKLENVQPINETVSAEIVSEDSLPLNRETTEEELRESFAELEKFWFRPIFSEDEQIGIEIQWIQDESILGKLGVLKGDMIKSVNGFSIKNIADLLNAINSFSNGERIDLEVSRENASIYIASGARLSIASNEMEKFRTSSGNRQYRLCKRKDYI